jgi:hypothetical protein
MGTKSGKISAPGRSQHPDRAHFTKRTNLANASKDCTPAIRINSFTESPVSTTLESEANLTGENGATGFGSSLPVLGF